MIDTPQAQYSIEFSGMHQINEDTGTSREVKREDIKPSQRTSRGAGVVIRKSHLCINKQRHYFPRLTLGSDLVNMVAFSKWRFLTVVLPIACATWRKTIWSRLFVFFKWRVFQVFLVEGVRHLKKQLCRVYFIP